jgi:hypothetical protein
VLECRHSGEHALCRQGNNRIDSTRLAARFQYGARFRAFLFLVSVSAAVYSSQPCWADWTGPTFPNGGPAQSSDELQGGNPDKLHKLENNIVILAMIRLRVQRTETYQAWMTNEDCWSYAQASLNRATNILTRTRPLNADTEKDAFRQLIRCRSWFRKSKISTIIA